MSSSALWYLGRGTGVVTLLLLTLVVVLGIVTRSGRSVLGLPRFGVVALHRSASLLAVTTLAIHVISMIADPYAHISLVGAALPFSAGYRPLWVGLGTLSLDLLVALVITSLLRQQLGARAWKLIHWSAYALFPFAVLHAAGSGSDVGFGWMRVLLIGCAGAVVSAVGWRASETFAEKSHIRRRPALPPRPHTRMESAR
jgi:methionine sulfoxide reductase heme-binding subunit